MRPYDEHMKSCPKCGANSIVGPTYIKPGGMEEEHMLWKCGTCGYIQYTECKKPGFIVNQPP